VGLAEIDVDWVALRLVLTYGRGVKGNMAQLMRLARSPYPLPLGGLTARRSVLSLDNLVEAIDTVLAAQQPLRRPLIVADPEPVTVPEMVAAMRRGLGRSPWLIPVPAPALRPFLSLAGRPELYEQLTGSLVVDTAALRRIGWQAPTETAAGLAQLMRS
jgi:nucleoside-diphosphate-sugar epimerase